MPGLEKRVVSAAIRFPSGEASGSPSPETGTTDAELAPKTREVPMKFKYFIPLLALQGPNLIISVLLFVFDEPPKPSQLFGYVMFNIFVCVNYWLGIRLVLKDRKLMPATSP